MKGFRAEWALSILVTKRPSSGIGLILFLTHLWGNSFAWLSPHQLFFFNHISCVSLRTHCSVPGWPTSLLACLAGYWGETCQATACFCLLPWFKQRGILTGLCLLGEVGYDERRPPCECTDSVAQNAGALPLHWETAYPVQSFPVTPAYPFLCILLEKMNGRDRDSSQIKNSCSRSPTFRISFGKNGSSWLSNSLKQPSQLI